MKKLILITLLYATIVTSIAGIHAIVKGESFMLATSLLANSAFCLAAFYNWKDINV